MRSLVHSSSLSQSSCSCSSKPSNMIKKVDIVVSNDKNASVIHKFHNYTLEKGASENHQINNLKVVIDFARFLGPISFYDVRNKELIISFLNGKIKSQEVDPYKKWITTWNHYLNRIKLFA